MLPGFKSVSHRQREVVLLEAEDGSSKLPVSCIIERLDCQAYLGLLENFKADSEGDESDYEYESSDQESDSWMMRVPFSQTTPEVETVELRLNHIPMPM